MIEVSAARVIEIHQGLIQKFGGDSTLKANQRDLVQSKIDAAKQGAFYSMQSSPSPRDPNDPLVLAAFLLKYFAQSQEFVDGNKRLAWFVAMDVLLQAGLTVDCDRDLAADFVVSVAKASGIDGVDAIANWLGDRLTEARER
jgi:prophage maintenance system killer protein